ncbi:MAG TPA: cysteine methyltransferase [Sphingobacteriaceae bacterium]|nr:cysteine methyltransferase [Sphingobacteriaceae bacterium]
MVIHTSILQTPIGSLVIEANETEVHFIGFKDDIKKEAPNILTQKAKDQLTEYFSGKRYEFDFPIGQTGTDFQQSVWKELINISAGKPISYTALSDKMSNPLAIRAIASANGKNKLMIVVPCHRVIGSNGDLVGYAGGLWRKKWLLEYEAKMTGIGQTVLSF